MNLNAASIGQHLKNLISGDVRFDTYSRMLYSTDASIYQILPLGVVVPKTKDDVVRLVQYCRENKISIHARGAGSGLCGESLGTGIIVDFTKYFNDIIKVDADNKTITVQPGVSHERVNRLVAQYGQVFGPDPASGNRCTFGGMTGNNSTGAHSLKYGTTREHLLSVETVLADGSILNLQTMTPQQLPTSLQALPDILKTNQPAIDTGYPKLRRNSAGYLLQNVLNNGQLDMAKLYCGSEGTLGIATEITVQLSELPKHIGLLLIAFESLANAGYAVPPLLESQPSSLELIDGQVIRIARQTDDKRILNLLPPNAQAILILEQDGSTPEEVQSKINDSLRIIKDSKLSHLLIHPALDRSTMELLWKIRKSTTPLLYKNPMKLEPVEFIDDAAVPASRLPEYFDALDTLFKKHDVQCAYYGHAGHGELHLRPFMDFKKLADIKKMEQISEEFFSIIMILGGTISGEHGEGLLRGGFVQRQYPTLFPVFKQIKNVFDPENILNPGKKIPAADHHIAKNLRYGTEYASTAFPTQLVWRGDELAHETERCNGCAECKTLLRSFGMCPIFKVHRNEEAAPRAKANLMRGILSGKMSVSELSSKEFKAIADLCVNCKMCHLECPSEVNIPKLMLEARTAYVQRYGLPLPDLFLSMAELMGILGTQTASITNWVMKDPFVRTLMDTFAGIHPQRHLPTFANRAFLQDKKHYVSPVKEPQDKIAYFVDMYANMNDPELGLATLKVLEHNRIEVIFPPQKWCGMPRIDYGARKMAISVIEYNVAQLAKVVKQGYKIICSEPTAALCLKAEYLDYVDSSDARLVAENTFELMSYLQGLQRKGQLNTDFKPIEMHLGYHAPCHMKALQVGNPGMELVQLIPGIQVDYINQGCCGIAGTYGFKTKNFETSMQAGEALFEGLRKPEIYAGLSECSTCKMQMEQGSGKLTIHPIKLLAQGYGLIN